MARRHYSDQQRADALAHYKANGGNVKRTARECSVPESTLRRWIDAPERAAPPELRAQKGRDLAARFEELAHAGLDALTPERLAEAPIRDVAVALGIAVDKARLLRGESTSITENRHEDARARVLHRLDKLAKAQSN